MTPLAYLGTAVLSLLGLVHRTKTLPEHLAEHPVRRRLLALVTRFQGTNETQLARAAGLTRGAMRHHLELLLEAGLLRKVPLGRENHYFPSKGTWEDAQAVAKARHRRAWRILREVLVEPGIRQKELAARVGMTRKVLRSHLNLLLEAGLVEERAVGRFREYAPSAGTGSGLWPAVSWDEPAMGPEKRIRVPGAGDLKGEDGTGG